MRVKAPPTAAIEALSREFGLACDPDGVITWMDTRAERVLGVRPGMRLLDLAAPGTEDRFRELVTRACVDGAQSWEVPLVIGRKLATVTFCAAPSDDGLVLVGHRIPEQFMRAIDMANESMSEVVSLNRELVRVNRHLEESHQGMLTMHSELEDRSDELRRTAEVKTRIVSQVGHEFRTPLHSIMGLTGLLLEGSDGELNEEQAKQVGFIRASAEELAHFVDDLLDLSRTEAGKTALRMERFDLGGFFASMRGVLRPLLPADSPVELVFDAPAAKTELETDKAKLSQILRNLVSNAIKFTERGEVRVTARIVDGTTLAIEVRDTGIGIAPADVGKIFEEFGQVDSHIQARVKGTGLGLPLAQRLANLLGGGIRVASEPGKGSTFTLDLPLEHAEVREMQELVDRSRSRAPGPASILVVEDDRKTLFIYERYLVMAGYHVMPARSVDEARALLATAKPAAIVLDIMLEGESSWTFLADLKRSPETHDIPVLVVTVTNREQKARALGADEFWLKPIDQDRLLKRLRAIAKGNPRPRVLVIDDDEKARYLIRKHLAGQPFEVIEAASGPEGVSLAQKQLPNVILLDFLLKEVTAFDVLDELKSDPRLRSIPVIIITSQALDVLDKRRLLAEAEAVISKQNLSRELALNRIRDALEKSGFGT